eukprot:PhM_4_TR14213/c0_g1_i2/m.101542
MFLSRALRLAMPAAKPAVSLTALNEAIEGLVSERASGDEAFKKLQELGPMPVLTQSSITPEHVETASRLLYAAAALGIPPQAKSTVAWGTHTALVGRQHLTAPALTRACVALTHFRLVAELASLAQPVVRLHNQLDAERAKTVLICFAECGLLHRHVDVIRKLSARVSLSDDELKRLLLCVRGHTLLYPHLIPMVSNSTLAQCTMLVTLEGPGRPSDKHMRAFQIAAIEMLRTHLKKDPRVADLVDSIALAADREPPARPVILELHRAAVAANKYTQLTKSDALRLLEALAHSKMLDSFAQVVQAVPVEVASPSEFLSAFIENVPDKSDEGAKQATALVHAVGGVDAIAPVVYAKYIRHVQSASSVSDALELVKLASAPITRLEACSRMHRGADAETKAMIEDIVKDIVLPRAREGLSLHAATFVITTLLSPERVQAHCDTLVTLSSEKAQRLLLALAANTKTSDFRKLDPVARTLLGCLPVLEVFRFSLGDGGFRSVACEVLRARAGELQPEDLDHVLGPKCSSLDGRTLHEIVRTVASSPHLSKDNNVFVRCLLAMSRREAFDDEWVGSHMDQFRAMSVDEKSRQEMAFAMALLARSKGKNSAQAFSNFMVPFGQWVTEKRLSREAVAAVARSMALSDMDATTLVRSILSHYFSDVQSLPPRSQTSYANLLFMAQSAEHEDTLISKLAAFDDVTVQTIMTMMVSRKQKSERIFEACIARAQHLNFRPLAGVNFLFACTHFDLTPATTAVCARIATSLLKEGTISTHQFSGLLNACARLNLVNDELRDALLSRFHTIEITHEELASIVFGLSRCDVDLAKAMSKIEKTLSKVATHLRGSQVGMLFTAFARNEDIPKSILAMLLPRMRELMPTWNPTEFTGFALPLIRCDNLPTAIGEELCVGVEARVEELSAAQAARTIGVLSRPYCRSTTLASKLVARVMNGVETLGNQELVACLASPTLRPYEDLQSKLIEHFTTIINTAGPLDVNFALNALARSGRTDAALGVCMSSITDRAPKLNNYELTTLLTNVCSAGLSSHAGAEALLERAAALCNSGELKPAHMINLISNIVKHDTNVGAVLQQLFILALECPNPTALHIANVLEIIAKNVGRHTFDPDVVLTHALPHHVRFNDVGTALSVVASCARVGGNAAAELQHSLDGVVRTAAIDDIIAAISKWPSLVHAIETNLKDQLDVLTPEHIAVITTAIRSSASNAGDTTPAPLVHLTHDALFSQLSSTLRANASIKASAAVSLLGALPTDPTATVAYDLAGTLRALTSAISGELRGVPATACIDALRVMATTTHPYEHKAIDVVCSRLCHVKDTLNIVSVGDAMQQLMALDVEDEAYVVHMAYKVTELRDSLLLHPSVVTQALSVLDYFGPHLAPKTHQMLVRLNKVRRLL